MKKFILFVAVVAAIASCSDSTPSKGRLDSNAKISLRCAVPSDALAPTYTRAQAGHLTALEIVQQASSLVFWNVAINPSNFLARGFADSQRDIENVRLLMWGTDIIDQDGNFEPYFIEATDMVLINGSGYDTDTIAYIPNSVMRAAELKIKSAFAQEDYTECYKLMDEAFTFIPIMGAEWRALKATNQQ